jgi:hypothetical protein
LATQVFVDVLVRDRKKSFGDEFWLAPRSTKTFYVLVIYQNFVQLPFSAMALGLSILQI